MFKLIQVFKTVTRRAFMPTQNYFTTFSVAMPAELLPILQTRLTMILLTNLYGTQKYTDMTTQELLDIDSLLSQYYGKDAHNFTIDGRQLSLLKRFVDSERSIIIRSRFQVFDVKDNFDLWGLMTDLLVSLDHPTQVIHLSFFGIQ